MVSRQQDLPVREFSAHSMLFSSNFACVCSLCYIYLMMEVAVLVRRYVAFSRFGTLLGIDSTKARNSPGLTVEAVIALPVGNLGKMLASCGPTRYFYY